MSLFKNLFNSNKPEKELQNPFPWKPFTSKFQLEEFVETSKTQTVFLFKHSTRCHISKTVMRRLEESFDLNDEQIGCYYLDLLNFRELSNEVAARFQVIHQSPQLLVIKNGACVAQGSHYEILEMDIK